MLMMVRLDTQGHSTRWEWQFRVSQTSNLQLQHINLLSERPSWCSSVISLCCIFQQKGEYLEVPHKRGRLRQMVSHTLAQRCWSVRRWWCAWLWLISVAERLSCEPQPARRNEGRRWSTWVAFSNWMYEILIWSLRIRWFRRKQKPKVSERDIHHTSSQRPNTFTLTTLKYLFLLHRRSFVVCVCVCMHLFNV